MKSKVFKRILSAILSIQMICAFTPAIVLNANAEELQMYLNEDFTSENNKWTGKTENMEILTDEEIPYMRYTAADTEQKITRKVDNTISGGSVYVAEFDVRFSDANSGVVELYGGSKLGPTVIFDGEKIKTKYGNPSNYDTMYQGAEANKWYNVKFLANGTTSMVGYTKAAGTDEEAQATKSEKVIRNLVYRINHPKENSLPKKRGRKPKENLRDYNDEIKRLKMENHLLRDFLSLIGKE